MNNQWIPIVGTLLGVVFGGLIAYFSKRLELRLQQKNERSKLVVAKIEEIHLMVSRFVEYAGNLGVHLKNRNNTEATETLNLDFINEFMSSLPKIYSMIRLFAPEADKPFNEFLDSLNDLHDKVESYSEQKSSWTEFEQAQKNVTTDSEKVLECLEKIVASLI